MKKFLFLISCLVLFGLAGCKHDEEPQKQSYTITVINECSDSIIVWGGSVPKAENNTWDWKNMKEDVFLDSNPILAPNGSIEITGKLASNEDFLVGGRRPEIDYICRCAVDKRYKYVYFRDSVGYVGEGEEKQEQKQIAVFAYTETGDRKDYTFTIQNNCDIDLTIAVGDFPKYNGKYEWALYNWYEIHDKVLVKAGESLEITGKLLNSYVFGIDVWLTDENQTSKGWYLDPHLGYITLLFDNSNPEKSIKGYQLAEKKAKIEDNGEADIYPLTIENGYTEPVIVLAGDVSIKGSGYNWDTVDPQKFLGAILLNPGDSFSLFGKIVTGKVFYVEALPLSGGGAGWAVTPNYDKVVIKKADKGSPDEQFIITIDRQTTSSGSSSSSQILLSTRNPSYFVSK